VKRFVTTVAPGGAEATVLNLNGLTITLACPAGSVSLRGNKHVGRGGPDRVPRLRGGAGAFADGFGNFVATTNANLNNNENRGTGSAQYLRGNGTGVTVLYGWREDAVGSKTACQAYGEAIAG
jgi:hypothetical protein